MSKRMLLSPAALTWLGSAFSAKTKISPFTTIQVGGFTEEGKPALREQGVIDAQNIMNPESYAVLETLAHARAYAGFRLSGSFGLVGKTAYFNDDKVVVIDNAGEGLVISSEVDVNNMAGILNEITGISRLVNAELNLKLGSKSALAFAALVDITRKYALAQYAGYGAMPVGYQAAEILDMSRQATGSRWLSAHIKNLCLPQLDLNDDELEPGLQGLLEAGLVEKGDFGYRLLGEAYDLAANFLIIENVVQVRCGQETAGQIVTGESWFLQAGLHDVLMVDVDAETVELNTVSTFTMMEYLQAMMLKASNFR